jgi:riboflavin synthase
MFTGIIESEGTILELTKKGNDIALTISYDQKIFDDIKVGDSISVNGICLTIEQFSKEKLKFHLSMESISKIAKFTLGQKVNLERSLKLNDRISGHFVFGHVDGIALIKDIEKLNDCEKWDIKVPSNLKKYIAKKGSISLNGTSLTVNTFENDILSVNLIPFTLGHTTFQYNKIGESLNVEIDMLARYVESINKNNLND